MKFIPGQAPILEEGVKVLATLPTYGEVEGVIVGMGSTDRTVNPLYLVQCTDGTFPDEVYEYSTFQYPLALIKVVNDG